MGFGSYDESEQQSQEMTDANAAEGVSVYETNHEGDVTFITDASADELLDQLTAIKSGSSDE